MGTQSSMFHFLRTCRSIVRSHNKPDKMPRSMEETVQISVRHPEGITRRETCIRGLGNKFSGNSSDYLSVNLNSDHRSRRRVDGDE